MRANRRITSVTLVLFLVAALALAGSSPAAAAPAKRKGGTGGIKPGTAWVNDAPSYAVRGDGLSTGEGGTLYEDVSIGDPEDCVSVLADDPRSRRGFFQLRTVKNSDTCNQNPERLLVLDLGVECCDVNQDESAEAEEWVFARFIAGEAFSRDAEENGTSVSILILETNDSGTDYPTTTQETAWELNYTSNAQVDMDEIDPNIRIITSEPGSSWADLCQIQLQQRGKKFKKVCEPRGSFDMPIQVIATRKSD